MLSQIQILKNNINNTFASNNVSTNVLFLVWRSKRQKMATSLSIFPKTVSTMRSLVYSSIWPKTVRFQKPETLCSMEEKSTSPKTEPFYISLCVTDLTGRFWLMARTLHPMLMKFWNTWNSLQIRFWAANGKGKSPGQFSMLHIHVWYFSFAAIVVIQSCLNVTLSKISRNHTRINNI